MFTKPEKQSVKPESPVGNSFDSELAAHESLNLDADARKPMSGLRREAAAMIGPSIIIKGELSGEEDLVIQGRVEGKIELKQNNLTIGKDGYVKANCRARILTVEGRVEGDLLAGERVVIRQSGDLHGNIVAPRVSLEDGAKFKGSIDMEPNAGSAARPVIDAKVDKEKLSSIQPTAKTG